MIFLEKTKKETNTIWYSVLFQTFGIQMDLLNQSHLLRIFQKYFNLEQQDSLLHILNTLHKGLSYEIDVEVKGEVITNQDRIMKLSLEAWKQFYEKEFSIIVDLFNGMYYTIVSCTKCDIKDELFEPFNTLEIGVPQDGLSHGLEQCLEVITSWSCEKCNGDGCKKKTKL
jgi:ubiquitin C-terminal hydrolase